ncbi:MAG TPA: hypothetical protein VNV85_00870 [Puia sp.]|jgi:hypothetical protein|nr:hypothetical protein [Puia sp.]
MTTKHLSETEMQQYALDKSGCGTEIEEHMQSCAMCRAEAQAYQQIFTSIGEQPKAVFGFDLSTLVLQQIVRNESKFSINGLFIYILVFVALSASAVAAYLFRKYLVNMFTGILPMTMYLILITALGILIFQSFEMYRKYQKQMSILN